MQPDDLRTWEHAVDNADNDALRISANLPENAQLGHVHVDGTGPFIRKYMRVQVVAGSAGSRWAYWKDEDEFTVIADRIFNGDQSHFVGMLIHEFPGRPIGQPPVDMWVLTEPKLREIPREQQWKPERLDGTVDGKRYEHSKEVYDVQERKSKLLP